jgi:hypothetical protein
VVVAFDTIRFFLKTGMGCIEFAQGGGVQH